MDLRRLKYFIRIAQDGSLTKASAELRIAQPALSRQIRALEDEVGIALFRRTARGMTLTDGGERLLVSIARPMREMELAIENARSFAGGIKDEFAIGLPSIFFGDFIAVPLLVRLNKELPNVRLRIVEGQTDSLLDWLNRGLIDFALFEGPSCPEQLSHHKLLSDRLMLVSGAGTNLDPENSIAFRDVAQLPLILSKHMSGLRAVLNDASARAKAPLNIHFETESVKVVKDLVEKKMGYSVLPSSYFRTEYVSQKMRYCPIDEPELNITINLIWKDDSKACRSFADLLKDSFNASFAELWPPHVRRTLMP